MRVLNPCGVSVRHKADMVMFIRAIIFPSMGFKQSDDLLVRMGKRPDVAADPQFGMLRTVVKLGSLFPGTEGSLI